MQNASEAKPDPPAQSGASGKTKKRFRILIVECDYGMLTCKRDPIAIFWTPNDVAKCTKIPREVTHLWISDFTLKDVRESLLAQAAERKIQIWTCVVGELCQRLLPLWALPHNRTLARAADPDKVLQDRKIEDYAPTGYDHSSYAPAVTTTPIQDMDEIQVLDMDGDDDEDDSEDSGQITRMGWREKAKANRLKKLRAAAKRYQDRKLVQITPVEDRAPAKPMAKLKKRADVVVMPSRPIKPMKAEAPPEPDSTLDNLAPIERMVYLAYRKGQAVEAIAAEFAMAAPNIQRLLARVTVKLGDSDKSSLNTA
jgi:hypothetical protein